MQIMEMEKPKAIRYVWTKNLKGKEQDKNEDTKFTSKQ